MENFVQRLICPHSISDDEAEHVSNKLGNIRIRRLAGEIAHNHVNKLFLALAHLRAIEDLSYYRSPAPENIINHLRHIQVYLTREKVHNFRSDVSFFLESVRKWQGEKHSEFSPVLEEAWKVIEEWLTLTESFISGVGPTLTELFERTKATDTALRNVFAILQTVDETPKKS